MAHTMKTYRRRARRKSFRVKLPPCRPMSEQERLIYEWSYSKFSVFLNCPLQFWMKYVLRVPEGPQPVIRVVGQALHRHARRFFEDRFQSAQTFADAWVGYWLGVVKGEHGPDGFNHKPVPIAWADPEKEEQHWIGRGVLYSKDFFTRNIDLREHRVVRLQEQDFRIDWGQFRLTGKIDRLDEHDDHATLTDYKMRRYPAYELDMLDQAMFYIIAYRQVFQPHIFHGKELNAVRLETFGTWRENAYQQVTIPDRAEEEMFYETLTRASTDLWALVNGKALPQETQSRLSTYPRRNSNGLPVLWPRLPRDKHCEYCDFIPQCIDWVRQHLNNREPNARFELLQHRAAERRASMATQEEFPLF